MILGEEIFIEDDITLSERKHIVNIMKLLIREDINIKNLSIKKNKLNKIVAVYTKRFPINESVKPKQEKKSAAQMMFGGGRKKISFEGEEADKPQWFLDNALHTIYDPHGTGKELKPRTILARSSDGNVRVQDVVRIYGEQGIQGLSELAWTSPLTQYIIEAYDSC